MIISDLKRITEQPGFIDTVCNNIANGGSLTQLSKTLGISFSSLRSFIRSEKEYEKLYMNALEERKHLIIDRLKDELERVAFMDFRDMFSESGQLLEPKDWPEGIAKTVQSFEVEELFEGHGKDRMQVGVLKKVKHWDKMKGIEMIGKTLALFVDKKEITGNITLEDLVAGSQEGDKS